MLLKKLRLRNIRSYIDEEMVFSEGIILLSGDIGSGKSTTLLAIDFALFGIRRGELSGGALLRNGAVDGYVSLNFLIGEKNIHIKRTLKKSSTGIVQDSGYLTINDVTQELTPLELKQRILEILNYPAEMLTKKLLIYRYTVYTPQEEMKLILLGEKENRIETLRKVFNIEKYKRVKENSKIVLSEVKQKKKEFNLITLDLDSKRLKDKEKYIELVKVKEQVELNKKRLEHLTASVILKKQEISESEKEIIKLNETKREFEVLKNTLKSKEDLELRILNQINILESQILELNSSIKNDVVENIKDKIIENEKLLDSLDKELREILNKKVESRSKKYSSEDIKSKILKLDFCPLCNQNVSLEHKHSVEQKEDELINKLNLDLELFIKKEDELLLKIKNLKELLQLYKNQDREFEISKVKLLEVRKKNDLIKNLKKELGDLDLIIKDCLIKRSLFDESINKSKDLELNYQSVKKELDILLEELKKLEMIIAVLNKDQEIINRDILEIKKDLEIKEKAKVKLEYYIKLQDFFEGFFINLTELIERKIMLKVHGDFNSLFQKWFSMLINSDLIKVRLDEEFTPIIEQNGHDIEYENLSGGEKTACALAYRLGLNQVINTVMSSINTKDLIILDEPTDGFSSEQLDKIRYVLEELNMKQVIIVSHESKIESFADNIIRINKEGHISKVNL